MGNLKKIFISHSHADSLLARSLKDSIEEIFEDCKVNFSTDKSIGGGIAIGSNWLQWINDQVMLADETFVLLTPNSVNKAWPMWESGAVTGVALAQQHLAGNSNNPFPSNVKPIRFQLPLENMPGPFRDIQSINGEESKELAKLMGDLLEQYNYANISNKKRAIEGLLQLQIPKLSEKITAALHNTPQLITEDIIQEWLQRLDDLRKKGRSSEVGIYHRWIGLMFEGPFSKHDIEKSRWDLRLHLRLGEMYHESNQFDQAINQFKHAQALAPLDIFVCHKLGIAYLDRKSLKEAEETMNKILGLDPDAAKVNSEILGLQGRMFKEKAKQYEHQGQRIAAIENYKRARDIYQVGLDSDPRSYYLADNVGQLSLKIGEKKAAQKAYEQAYESLMGRKEKNIWTLATTASAAIFMGKDAEALDSLRKIRKMHPTEKDLFSIREGLRVIQSGLNLEPAIYDQWMSILDNEPFQSGHTD